MSEMDWTNKNVHPSKVVSLGDVVNVMVLEIDEERRRISLGMKQCVGNPWQNFAQAHAKGEKVQGKIRSITDFGIFIGLEGDIDGLVHLSDISWSIPGEEAVKQFKKGQELEAVILVIDADRERISLGIKQLEEAGPENADPAEQFAKGAIVSGTVASVEAKLVTVTLDGNVTGKIKVADLSAEKVTDATTVVAVGDTIEAKVMTFDKKTQTVTLSVKAKDAEEEAEAIKKYSKSSKSPAVSATLGDLLKEKMEKKDNSGE
jgi:small subunit ribosomal protein S1